MRFNIIDRLYTLGFGEQAVRYCIYLEATDDRRVWRKTIDQRALCRGERERERERERPEVAPFWSTCQGINFVIFQR